MRTLDQELSERLAGLEAQHLSRSLQPVDSPQGRAIRLSGELLLNFSSNDYLGLAGEPALKAAAAEAVGRYGAGCGASRLLSGSLAPHHELEAALARFKGTEAALSFSSGYAAALGTICALMGKGDVVILDKLSHACLVDAARLCGAELRVFHHGDLVDLERILNWAAQRPAASQDRRAESLIVTESVFSMDGDFAPLRQIADLKDRYGAWLMVDEAHATGLFGPHRRGLAEHFGVADRVDVQMGTLGKALGSAGGYICGSTILANYLLNKARSFIFSTAPVPAAAAAATAAIRIIEGPEGELRAARVAQLSEALAPALPGRSDSPPNGASFWSGAPLRPAILPLMVGSESGALSTAAALRREGIYVPAIRYPTVARGAARLRISLSAAHTLQDVEALQRALRALGVKPPLSAACPG